MSFSPHRNTARPAVTSTGAKVSFVNEVGHPLKDTAPVPRLACPALVHEAYRVTNDLNAPSGSFVYLVIVVQILHLPPTVHRLGHWMLAAV